VAWHVARGAGPGARWAAKRRADGYPGSKQMDVAEFVPEVATVQGGLVAVAEQVLAVEGGQHPQVRGTRLVAAR